MRLALALSIVVAWACVVAAARAGDWAMTIFFFAVIVACCFRIVARTREARERELLKRLRDAEPANDPVAWTRQDPTEN